MRFGLRFLCAGVFLGLAAPLLAQTVAANTADLLTPIPGIPHDYINGLDETVNPADGSVSIRLPAPTPKERGFNPPLYAYLYDSNGQFQLLPTFQPGGSSGYQELIHDITLYGTGSNSTGGSALTGAPSNSGAPGTLSWTPVSLNASVSNNCFYITDYVYTDFSGGRHPLNLIYMQPAYDNTNSCGYFGVDGPNTTVRQQYSDGIISAFFPPGLPYQTPYVYDLDGTQLNPDLQIEDRNGNYPDGTGRTYSATYTAGTVGPNGIPPMPISLQVPGDSKPYTYTYPNTVGTVNVPISLPIIPGSLNIAQCPSAFANGTAKPVGNTVITLPNSQKYTIAFDPNYGLVSSITYPDGGTVTYTWEVVPDSQYIDVLNGVSNDCYYRYGWPALQKRVVSFDGANPAQEQDFSYTTSWGKFFWTSKTTTVKTKDLTRKGSPSFNTVYTYFPVSAPIYPGGLNSDATTPVEQSIAYYDYSGALLKTVTKSWLAGDYETAECTTLPNNQTSGVFYQPYNVPGVVTDKAEYDYGQVATACQQPSSKTVPIRETKTAYAENLETAMQTYILDQPSSVKVYGNNTLLSETDYTYDQGSVSGLTAVPLAHDQKNYISTASPAPSRGNATTVTQRCLVNCTDASSTFTFDETGQITSTTDPLGNPATLYSYADAYASGTGSPSGSTNTYLTQVTGTLPDGTKVYQNFTYGFEDGKVRTSEDENSQKTTYCYLTGGCSGSTADPFARVTEVDTPDGGSTITTYADTSAYVETSTKLNASTNYQSKSIMDGYGHVTETLLLSDPSGQDEVDIAYDGLGHVASESNPYRTTSEPTYGITQFTYDALDRLTKQVDADGTSTQTWTYTNNSVTYTDENNNKWQRTSNALGNLMQVLEPNGAATTASMETDYGYDALSNLLSVTQCGGPCPSTNSVLRSFTYDGLSRLLTANNPESGTSNYTYDVDGNITQKTSPAVNASSGTQTIGYCYDSLNRMTAKFYSAPPTKCTTTGAVATYSYDSSPISGAANTVGRLTDEKAYIGGTLVSERSPYSYDAMGRILHEQQCPYSPACTAAYTFNYAYDLAGNLTNSNNGLTTAATSSLGLTFGFSYDGAGHMQSAGTTSQPSSWNGTASGTNYPTVLMQANQTSPVSYDPMGHLINAQLGLPTTSATAALNLARQYDNRGRITLEMDDSITFYQIPTTPVSGYAANGNLLSINDTITGNWTYGYDTLNRLTSAVSTSGPFSGDYGCWTYDAFGNRTLEALSSTTLTPCAANANDNVVLTPLTPIAGTNRATNFTYDDAGNVQNDGNNAYEYDAEGRICEAANTLTGSISIYQYLYDAEGRRVAKGSTTSTKCAAPTSANGFQLTNQYLLGQSGEQVTELGGTSGITPSHTNVWTSGGQLNTYDFAHGGLHFSLHDAVGTKRIQISGAGVPELSCASLPFGNSPGNGRTTACVPWGSSTAPDATEHHFTGQIRDTESGNDFFNARYYASNYGRFLSPDPSGLFYADPTNPQSLNLYSYAQNNPFKNTDPDGLRCVWDDGSFDAEDDPTTGNQIGCEGQGGRWETPNSYASGVDWASTNQDGTLSLHGVTGSAQSVTVTGTITGFTIDTVFWTEGYIANVGVAYANVSNYLTGGTDIAYYRFFMTHYCGPGGAGDPTGVIDRACKAHDECYAAAGIDASANTSSSISLTLQQASAAQACNQALYNAARSNPQALGSNAFGFG